MLAGGVEHLVHLERRGQGFDQHGDLDRSAREIEPVLDQVDDVVPQSGLVAAFELGDVEIGTRAVRDRGPGIVEGIKREVEEAP